MKNKCGVFIELLVLISILFFHTFIYTEEPEDLRNVKNSLQSLISDNSSEQSTSGNAEPDTNKSSSNQEWFLQHQKAWDIDSTKPKSNEGIEGNQDKGKGGEISTNTPNVDKGGGESSWIYYFLRTIVALILVLGLLFLVIGSIRFFVQKGASQYGRVLGKVVGVVYLSPRAKVYYLQTGGKVIALGVSGDRINLLFSMDEDEFFSNLPEGGELQEGKTNTFHRVLEDVEQRIKEKSVSEDKTKVSLGLDDDIASLKANIQKLQEVLKEDSEEKEGK